MLGDVLDVEDLGQFLDRGALGRVHLQQRPDRVRYLAAAAIADRHVHQQAGAVGRGLARVLEGAGGVGRQQVERAHRVEVPVLRRQLAHGVLDDPQQRGELTGRAGQVVRGQQPEGDDLHAAFLAPLQQLEDLVGALLMAAADIGEAG